MQGLICFGSGKGYRWKHSRDDKRRLDAGIILHLVRDSSADW
jgi:hypothetical protein